MYKTDKEITEEYIINLRAVIGALRVTLSDNEIHAIVEDILMERI